MIEEEAGSGVFFSNTFAPTDEKFGSAAFAVIGHSGQVKAMWFRGGWFDLISVLWREVSCGQFRSDLLAENHLVSDVRNVVQTQGRTNHEADPI